MPEVDLLIVEVRNRLSVATIFHFFLQIPLRSSRAYPFLRADLFSWWQAKNISLLPIKQKRHVETQVEASLNLSRNFQEI